MVKVAVLLRCHNRTWQLEGTLNQCLLDMPKQGVNTQIVLMPDKPTPEVQHIVDTVKGQDRVHVVLPPPCSEHRWAKTGMEGLNVGMDYIDKCLPHTEIIHFRDDDEMLGIGWSSQLLKCLEDRDTLAWLAVSLYVWQDLEGEEPIVNLNQMHYSPIFFRYIKGDRFPTDGRSVQVTTQIQKRILRNKYRKRTLPFYLYDYGVTNYTALQVKEMVGRMNAAGKDDRYTKAFTDIPTLMELSYILRENIPPIEMIKTQLRKKGMLA